MIFKRKLYKKMLEWKINENGNSALLIKGARRVGKSTLVEEFAKNEYKSYILIDFSTASREVIELFDDLSDLNYIFLRLQVIYRVNLIVRESVIIFDEVQTAPKARQAIKHLVKDHRYDYIETGSLISIRKNVENIVIPSEETRVQLLPMDYEEFKWALGDNVTVPLLKELLKQGKPLGNDLNRKMMRDFRVYMLVGGMPQAVARYIETNNLSMVDQVKRNIIDLYEEDFVKIDPSGQARIIFDNIPSQLSSNSSRYNVSSVISGQKNDRVREIISNLVDSMTVNIAYHVNDPNIGLSLNRNIDKYKLFLCDTGLFITLAFKDKSFTENVIYEKMLSDKINVNMGYIFENMVAQIFTSLGDELYYHTFLKENSTHNYEIDFLLSRGNKLCPIEVKSSNYKTHPSIDAFCKKYSSRVGERYLVYTKDYSKDQETHLIPIYLTYFL